MSATSRVIQQIASAWGKHPLLIKDGLDSPIFTAQDFLNAMKDTATALGKGEELPRLRLNVGIRQTFRETDAFIPEAHVSTLDAYESQLRSRYPNEELGIVIDHADVVLDAIRQRMEPTLHGVFSEVGYPARPTHACIYAGNYQATPFGIHIDDCHVLMACAVGTKRMAFWRREQFEKLDDAFVAGSKTVLKVSVADHLARAEIIEIGPRDLVYWPPQLWHVGLGDTQQFHASLSIGIYHRGAISEIVRFGAPLPAVPQPNAGFDVFDTLDLHGLSSEPPPGLVEAWAAAQQAMGSESAAELAYARHLLCMSTSAGFGPLSGVPDESPLSDTARLVSSAKGFAWRQIGTQVVIASNGHTLAAPASTRGVCERLTNGESFPATELYREIPAERHAQLSGFLRVSRLAQVS